MKLVTTRFEIESNVDYLDEIRREPDTAGQMVYRDRIKRGTCFLPYERGGVLAFAPSRFIGYSNNNFEAHDANEQRDGRITNRALIAILGSSPVPSVLGDSLYRAFCETLGFDAPATGTFGAKRKFWLTDDLQNYAEEVTNRSIQLDSKLSVTERFQISKARVGQGLFRSKVIDYWRRCSLTGFNDVTLLRASHIKPWVDSTNKEKLDPFNGLLLTPNLDALFDKGFITFEQNGKMVISDLLDPASATLMGLHNLNTLKISARHKPYLEYHRLSVFRKS